MGGAVKPTAATERELADLHPDLRERVRALITDSPYRITITSAWRSRAEQQRLYDGWKQRLPGFNPANPPGRSKHEKTLNGQPASEAADLAFSSAQALAWAHERAPEYRLCFPIPRESWHVEASTALTIPEDDMALTDEDVQRVADAVYAKTNGDAVAILRGKDHPSLTKILALLTRIVTKIGA